MKGDFTRSSFQPAKHYSGVRMQQGRVQLDADWNEQIDILGHQIRTPLTDILGGRAVPAAAGSLPSGFEIKLPSKEGSGDGEQPPLPDFTIGSGHCYVGGILCENEADLAFSAQGDFPGAAAELDRRRADGSTDLLVYLDVWTRHVTALEDPELREPALDGPDTTTRTQTVWQVRLGDFPGPDDGGDDRPAPAPRGTLNVHLAPGRMRENQLYRVEVQRVVQEQGGEGDHLFFKWSRENASVAYAIKSVGIPSDSDTEAKEEGGSPPDDNAEANGVGRAFLIHLLDHDPSNLHLAVDDWVEFVSDPIDLGNEPQPLLLVTDVQVDTGRITVQARADSFYFDVGQGEGAGLPDGTMLTANHAYLRRWEQRDLPADNVEGCVRVPLPSPDPDNPPPSDPFVLLENGLSVQFDAGKTYTPGDYWMIPARVQFSRDDPGLLWPQDGHGDYLPLPPQGEARRSAPLARLQLEEGTWTVKPWMTCYDEHVEYKVRTDAESEPVWASYTYTYRGDHIAKPLPQLTANLGDVNSRLKTVEGEVAHLDARVTVLEEQMERILAWMNIERTRLFQDLPSRTTLEVGDVVAVDLDNPPGVKPAKADYEHLVLGVVGDVLDDMTYYDEIRYRIIVHGLAECKVYDKVTPGSLLVPSLKPGHAGGASLFIRPGSVIGKALEAFTPDGSRRSGRVKTMVTLG